jgi:outer membrane immunogenic protein
MKRIMLAAFAVLTTFAMAAPLFAADLPRQGYGTGYGTGYRPAYKAPMWVAPFSWSGFYAGINGGYGFGTSDWTGAATAGSAKPKGALAGVTLGYNLQTGVWVWGVEGDFDGSWMKNTGSGTGVCAGIGCEINNTWLGTTRLRVGYAWDRWLPYLTGGAAFGNIKMTPNTGLSESKTKVGWTAGAGVEWAFAGTWSAKFEYLYVDLGKATCGAACVLSTDVSFKASVVRLGVNYRFF